MIFRYIFIFILSYLSLLWERLWNRFWTVASLLLLLIALSLLNIPTLLGVTGHLVFLGLSVVALAATLFYSKDPFSFPTRDDVDRRIEKTSALEHRPLETLHDTPVEGLTADSLNLWRAHLQKTAGYINRLRIYKPHPLVAKRDRYELRHLAVIFVALGLMVAQGDSVLRLRSALTPDIETLIGKNMATLDLWITPPEYTHEPAVFLATAGQGLIARAAPLSVPQGSLLKLRMTGYRFAPKFQYGGEKYALTEPSSGDFTLDLPLQQSGTLLLTSLFSRVGEWAVTVAPDMPPEISISKIEATPRSATKITYKAHDDHGIAKITGTVALTLENALTLGGEPYRFDIPVSSSETAVEDLASNLWAGLPATITLTAQDNASHTTVSAPFPFTLPERIFTNPIAKSLIRERKKLLWKKDTLTRRAAADKLASIADLPDLYKGDIVVFMALSTAVRRLMYDGSDKGVASVQGLLWDVALKLEDGGLSLAQRELRDSLQKMSAALNDKNLSQQQVQELADDVRQKMQQYIQALVMEMQQRLREGKNVPLLSPGLAQKFMKNIDLGKILAQMQRMTQMNSREDLQKMADGLKNMLDNLDMKQFDQMREKQMQAMKALQGLEDIIHGQQALFDKTNKTRNPAEAKKQQQEQSGLRQRLGDALRSLGEVTDKIPPNLAQADLSMKQSENALGEGHLKASLPHQKNALDELQKGTDEMAGQMAQSMQQSILSFGMPMSGGNFGEGFDPLGRPNGNADNSSIKIPDEKEQRRVQEIIQELRNRSNEPNRAKVERDYLDRLLNHF